MERSEPSVILARVIVCLTFAGMVEAGKVCDKVTYDAAVYEYCVEPFSQAMANTDYQHNCPWPSTRRQYDNLMLCLENVANFTCCTHTSYRHHTMLDIHKVYFSVCSYIKDPGFPILLLLIMPCVIVPLMIPFLWEHFNLHEYRLPNND